MSSNLLPAPPPELVALLGAVHEFPDEPAPRLALADWLAKRGDERNTARAEFLRKKNTPKPKSRRKPAGRNRSRGEDDDTDDEDREDEETRELREEYNHRPYLWELWLGPLAALTSPTEGFQRGLPVVRNTSEFLKPEFVALLGSEYFAFVGRLMLFFSNDDTQRLADLPELRHVGQLYLHAGEGTKQETVAKLFGSPHLSGMIDFELSYPAVSNGAAQALAQNPALTRLRRLAFNAYSLTDKGIIALTTSPHLGGLTSLELDSPKIGDAGAEALVNSTHLRNLKHLFVNDFHGKLTDHGQKLLRTRFGDYSESDLDDD